MRPRPRSGCCGRSAPTWSGCRPSRRPSRLAREGPRFWVSPSRPTSPPGSPGGPWTTGKCWRPAVPPRRAWADCSASSYEACKGGLVSDRALAEEWLEQDPDPETRTELRAHLDDPAALAARFGAMLEFVTAGRRGELGAGPYRMNRVTVMRAAAGLAAVLTTDLDAAPSVVIGYDARHKSDVFAEDSAAVLTGAGITVHLMPRPLPTPVLRAGRVRRAGGRGRAVHSRSRLSNGLLPEPGGARRHGFGARPRQGPRPGDRERPRRGPVRGGGRRAAADR